MALPCDLKFFPAVYNNGEWWKEHVRYFKFRRQGIDIVCASFEQKINARANVIVVTGWNETFLKYSELIKVLYERGFNIYTYDHQSQGLSGRWLLESQSTWIHSFDDYVDDFTYFVTAFPKANLPIFVIAHSMGGLITSIAMSRLPNLVNRAVLLSPMIRNKCGTKAMNYRFPLPQPLVHWIVNTACHFGLGTMHCFGFFKEKSTDILPLYVTTSDQQQLNHWQILRQHYPNILSTCVTMNWLSQSIYAQNRFETRYEFVKTNTLILTAEHDCFVYNRGTLMFARKAPACRVFIMPKSYHELLGENDLIRHATISVICDYLTQKSDDVSQAVVCSDFIPCDNATPLYSLAETVIKSVGILVASVGAVLGLTMIFGDFRFQNRR